MHIALFSKYYMYDVRIVTNFFYVLFNESKKVIILNFLIFSAFLSF